MYTGLQEIVNLHVTSICNTTPKRLGYNSSFVQEHLQVDMITMMHVHHKQWFDDATVFYLHQSVNIKQLQCSNCRWTSICACNNLQRTCSCDSKLD